MVRIQRGVKRPRSPDPNNFTRRRPRRTYFVETPGGSMRDVTPAKATRKLYGCMALRERPRKMRRLIRGEKADDQDPDINMTDCEGPPIRDTVLAGIRLGFAKQKADGGALAVSIRNAVSCPDDPRLIFQGLDAHTQTVGGMQRAIAERLGVRIDHSPQQDLNDIDETGGLSEMIHPDMSAPNPDDLDFPFHNFEHFVFREPHV